MNDNEGLRKDDTLGEGLARDEETDRRERAYAIWERDGRPDNRHLEHWEEAGLAGIARSDAPNADTGPADTPAGTAGEREARGGGDQPIPASAPVRSGAS